MTSVNINDANALLIYRLGPVLCCSPTFSVENVMMPPAMTHAPGSTSSMPGIFKTMQGIVKAVDLRKRFGVDEAEWMTPGRIVIVEVEGGFAGLWVDEIINVIQCPAKGWGEIPSGIPKDVFTKVLLLNDDILLYADFEILYKFKEVGYLRQHIKNLKEKNTRLEKNTEQETAKKTQAKKKQKHLEKIAITENTVENQQAQTQIEIKSDADADNKKNSRLDIFKKNENNIKAPSINSYVKIESEVVTEAEKLKYKDLINNKTKITPFVTKHKKYNVVSDINHNPSSHDSNSVGSYSIEKNRQPSSMAGMYLAATAVFFLTSSAVFIFFDTSESRVQKKVGDETVVLKEIKAKELASVYKIQDDNELFEKNDNQLETASYIELESIDSKPNDFHADIKNNEEGIVIVLTEEWAEEQIEASFEETADRNLDDKSTYEALKTGQALTQAEGSVSKGNEPEEQIKQAESVRDQVPAPTAVSHQTVSVKDEIVTKESIVLPNQAALSNSKYNYKKTITHVVVKGDTLWHIAKRYINDPYRYPELAKLSQIKNPDLIYPGNKVKIIYRSRRSID